MCTALNLAAVPMAVAGRIVIFIEWLWPPCTP